MNYLIKIIVLISFLLISLSSSSTKEINKGHVLIHVNMARKKGCTCGTTPYASAPALKWNAKLEKAAQLHCDYMYNSGHYSHNDSLGNNFADRLDSVGYIHCCGGENIARINGGISDVITMWLQSEGHCRNIMNPQYTEIGLARHGRYWTMVTAKPLNE